MIPSELRTLDDKGLLLRRQDLIGELTSLKFQAATGQLENTASTKAVRRALARVETIIREREREQEMAKGGLALAAGKLDSNQSAFSAFRKFMGTKAE